MAHQMWVNEYLQILLFITLHISSQSLLNQSLLTIPFIRGKQIPDIGALGSTED